MTNARIITTVTPTTVATGLRAGGRAFVDTLALVLLSDSVKLSDKVERTVADIKVALITQHNDMAGAAAPPQAAAPNGDKARGFLVQGYKSCLNYASMLRKAVKAENGLDLIRAAFEGGYTVSQFEDSLPVSEKKKAKAADILADISADAPADAQSDAPAAQSPDALVAAIMARGEEFAAAVVVALQAAIAAKEEASDDAAIAAAAAANVEAASAPKKGVRKQKTGT